MASRNSRLFERLERLETRIKPKGRASVFFGLEGPGLSSYSERLAAFKTENNIGPNDVVHTVKFTFV